MRNLILCALVFLCMCDAAPVPPSVAALEHAQSHSPIPRHHPQGPVAAPVADSRTPAEIAQAACAGQQGWRCPARKPLFGARPPIVPASWTVPAWYTDPANGTTCALDTNTCTSATCSAGGVGPCKTVNEIVARWGTTSPILPQNTTINVLSAETLGQEHIVLEPVVAAGSYFAVIDTPALVAGPFALGTVTAKNRATPQLLKSTGFTAGGLAVGQLVVNTTHSSHAWIYALSASGDAGIDTATLSQPLAPFPIANISNLPASMPAEVDTWATSDSVSVYSIPLLNIDLWHPRGSQTNGGVAGGTAWLQNAHIPDVSGSAGNSFFSWGDVACAHWLYEDLVDAYVVPDYGTSGIDSKFGVNNFFNGGAGIAFGTLAGGVSTLYGCSIAEDFGDLDGDIICHGGFSSLGVFGQGFAGYVYLDGAATLYQRAGLKIDNVWYSNAILWGPGTTLNASDSSVVENVTGNTWANTIKIPTLQIDGQTTATKYVAGTFTGSVSVTAANIDSFSGLQNPLTGARMSNTN